MNTQSRYFEAIGNAVPVSELTSRERDVLILIARGMDNVQMADALYLGVNTIKTYVRQAYSRIGVTNRAHATIWALRHDLADEHHSTEV